MATVGYILLFVGCIGALAGEFMLLGLAFKRSLLWFFGCLIFQVLWFAFFCLNPKTTAKPLGILLIGVLTMYFGCHLTGTEFL